MTQLAKHNLRTALVSCVARPSHTRHLVQHFWAHFGTRRWCTPIIRFSLVAGGAAAEGLGVLAAPARRVAAVGAAEVVVETAGPARRVALRRERVDRVARRHRIDRVRVVDNGRRAVARSPAAALGGPLGEAGHHGALHRRVGGGAAAGVATVEPVRKAL